ncbi:MAG: ABC transporter permease [Spirochaetales bacterium]|nr:ABC transporter permease [Spirochaetales bacterium]
MAVIPAEAAPTTKKPSLLRDVLRRLVKEKPLGLVGGIITLLMLLTGIFADFIAPYGLNETNMMANLKPYSREYWLGTDNLGRDMLSNVIYGARISMIVGLAAATLATVLSTILGSMCGYIGRKFDLLVQRFVDIWMGVPQLILLIIIMSIIGPGIWQVSVVLGISWGIVGSRIVRGAVITVKENAYIDAAKCIGSDSVRIFFRHVLPNILAPTIVLFTVRVANAILTEASLSFLGFGIPPPAPSWGGMLSGSGRSYMFLAPWMVIWPGVALSAVVFGVNMFGDALRDIFDPRLRRGLGRFGVAKPKKLRKEAQKAS